MKVESRKPVEVLEESSDEEYLRQKFKKGKRKEKTKKAVESKIKFLIDRDKNNKMLEKKLQKQQQQIQRLEKQMEEQQIEKEKEKNSRRKIKILSSDILSLSSDSFSSVNEKLLNYHSNELKQYPKNRNESSNQEYEGDSFSDV